MMKKKNFFGYLVVLGTGDSIESNRGELETIRDNLVKFIS